MTTTFENAKVGDKVWSSVAGWGEIVGVDHESSYGISVELKSYRNTFTKTGKSFSTNEYRTLFWAERKWADDTPTQPEAKPDYKLDDPILVKSYISEAWNTRHFKEWDGDRAVCWNDGRTSHTTNDYISTITWTYHKPLPDYNYQDKES